MGDFLLYGEANLKIPDWFHVANYDSAENWTAAEWSNAIFDRLVISQSFDTDKAPLHEIFVQTLIVLFNLNSEILDKGLVHTWNAIMKEIHLNPKGVDKSYLKFHKTKLKPVEPVRIGSLAYWTKRATQGLNDEIKDYIFDRKASFPLPENTEEIVNKTLEERNIEIGRDPESWDNGVLARINLAMPKKLLLKQLSDFIDENREKYQIQHMKKPPSKANFRSWHDGRILGYFDLQLISRINQVSLTQEQIGKLLFPEEFDVALADRVRGVTRPLANFAFRESICTALDNIQGLD
jgi:hypothetical protein